MKFAVHKMSIIYGQIRIDVKAAAKSESGRVEAS